MKSYKAFPFLTLLACLSLCSCYHEFPGSGNGGGGGGGGTTTANVSFVMVADTPPATLGLLSFKVVPTAITLTPSSGTATTFNINNGTGYSFDLARLQSDSAFLGTVQTLPTGTYTSIAVTFLSAQLAFYNGTGASITGLSQTCLTGTVCFASFSGPFTSTVTTSQAINSNTGLGIDVNLSNLITLTGTALSLNFTNSVATPVVTTFALPRDPNLTATGQLELIEDFTGIATISGTSVTIAPAPGLNRASITALSNSSTNYNIDPTNTLCNNSPTSLSTCFTSSTGEAASMDAVLNSDGTFTIQEIEPLLASPTVDTVEGTVISIPSSTQFDIVITDIIPAASNSLISSLGIGVRLTVNLTTAGSGPAFWVDTKGLAVGTPTTNFQVGSDTTAIHMGQSVAVHVNAFTAANNSTTPPTPAIANNVDTITLRWSRFIATVGSNTSVLEFNITALPVYFGFTQASVFDVQTFGGTPGGPGVTNLDFPTSGLVAAAPVGIRALYLQNNTNTQDPVFFAAKVRQH
jgi:hypothetical protein